MLLNDSIQIKFKNIATSLRRLMRLFRDWIETLPYSELITEMKNYSD